MKKIFILTGEASGDRLAAKVIQNLKIKNPNINYLSVGGENLKSLGIKSIYDLNKITYLGFTNVLLNIFNINKKINETVKAIIEYKPDILFTVDSPDFTLRVAERVKKIDRNIKTVHYVAPQVWIWREGRARKMKKFIDHILLLFSFEKKYFEKEKINCVFVGHPLLEKKNNTKIDLNQIMEKNKAIISIFEGRRESEINILMPILINFVELMNKKYTDFTYIFHSTKKNKELIQSFIKKNIKIFNCETISDDKIKAHLLSKSIFAVSKSGTVSLEISNAKIPSIIIYKINLINYLIIKVLVKTKYVNIINIAAKEEIIPELLQSNCNALNIFKYVVSFLENPEKIKSQINRVSMILKTFKTESSPSEATSEALNRLISK